MYIDTHAHLNFKAFNNDYSEAIDRAQKANVSAIINVGSNLKTSLKAVEIAQKYPNVFAAIGLHPIHVKAPTQKSESRHEVVGNEVWPEAEFEKLARHKKVVAIGETGLDYYYDKSSAELQKEIFEKSLKLAMSVSKPVILHSRDASDDMLSVLMAKKPEPKGVMHCFAGDWPMAKMILDMGLYISFTGLVTFTKNYQTFEVIKNMPLDRLLIETDCPYMTPTFVETTVGKPEPHRGKRNEPAYVVEVARKIAEIRKIPQDVVEEQTTKNAKELFKI